MDQALSDVTVIDLGQVKAMPFCAMLLTATSLCDMPTEAPDWSALSERETPVVAGCDAWRHPCIL
jgi:crotonobetainyl-CoA:carnitine CoA-transferase CaiB-like acyl-CoA transferase